MEESFNIHCMLITLLLLPLAGFIINGLLYPVLAGGVSKTKATPAGTIASLTIFSSFVLACLAAYDFAAKGTAITVPGFTWLSLSTLQVEVNFTFDRLSALMTLVITGVGSLIHIYSIGYMAEEKGAARFFSYLNLFCFFMLLLVLSDDLMLVFCGWEGVGLCSFLLIGYWHQHDPNCDAARKAFIVNRVGDLGFILAIVLLAVSFQTLSLAEILQRFATLDNLLLSVIGALFFFAATGKSAQFPLYVWLPDAMAGPTPVSALIHAATMVTAGIYLFARLSLLFDALPTLMVVVAWVGVLTSLAAGKIATTQNDVKKVLAYSTVSQLGFMFLAIGVGAFDYAVFHLMTHAFFKALLFLAAGSLIHGLGGEQNMERMGGLLKHFPITSKVMLIGCAALLGLPLFSGFFSKDGILFATAAMPRGGMLLFICGVGSAFLTGLYTFRMIKMIFFGTLRSDLHPHESPAVMTIPLLILAVLSVIGGYFGMPLPGPSEHIADPALSEHLVSVIAVLAGLLGMGLGYIFYRSSFRLPALPLRSFVENKFYVDECYQAIFIRPFNALSALVERTVEVLFRDKIAGLLSQGSNRLGALLRTSQTGDLHWYAIHFAAGVTIVIGISLLWIRL